MVEVPLANGRGVALVDDEDAEIALRHHWHRHEARGCVYARSRAVGYLHRLIARPGEGFEVDHIDGDGLNNQRANLRTVTHAQNHQNRSRQAGRTSQYRGVSWWKTRGKWTVRVKVRGVTHHGGHYDDEHEAGRAAAALRAALMPYATA